MLKKNGQKISEVKAMAGRDRKKYFENLFTNIDFYKGFNRILWSCCLQYFYFSLINGFVSLIYFGK